MSDKKDLLAVDYAHVLGRISTGYYGTVRGEQSGRFYDDLLSACGVAGHKNAAKAFGLAWQWGHSSGLHEVADYFDDIAELLK